MYVGEVTILHYDLFGLIMLRNDPDSSSSMFERVIMAMKVRQTGSNLFNLIGFILNIFKNPLEIS